MSKQRRTAGVITFSAAVIQLPDGFATERSTSARVRHNLTLLSNALHSFGPFHLGDSLTPADGTFAIDVLCDHGAEDRSFDQLDFHAYVRRLGEACTTALTPGADDIDLESAAQEFAVAEGVSPDKVTKVFRAVMEGAAVTVECGNDEGIYIVRPPCSGPHHQAFVDIEIAQMLAQTHIDTDSDSYDMDDAAAQDIELGDYIAVEISPDGETYRVADAAVPLPEETPSLFGEDAKPSSEPRDTVNNDAPPERKR